MALSTGVLLGLGAAAGGITGAMGTPDTGAKLPELTPEQQKLVQQAKNMFQAGQLQIGQQEQDILARLGLQQQAQGGLQSILGGQAFQATPEELASINQQRQASIQANQDAINQMLDERLKQIGARSAARGVRGQALSELQGQAAIGASQQLQGAVNQANILAAQQAMQLPYQRAQLQAQVGGSFANFADQLRQQAIQNRMMFQTPGLLDMASRERLAQAYQPGQSGGIGDVLLGGLSGAATLGTGLGNLGQGAAGLEKLFG